MTNLAGVLRVQGNLAKAARLHRESLSMLRRVYGATAANRDVAACIKQPRRRDVLAVRSR
jgi:hypothetical protein